MTLLTACQEAAVAIISTVPQTIFSTQEKLETELRYLANRAGRDMMRNYDWQELTKPFFITGTGTIQRYEMPPDFGRMILDAKVSKFNSYTEIYTQAPDMGVWLDVVNGMSAPQPGYWLIIENFIVFRPAIPLDVQVIFYYISKWFARDSEGNAKAAFTTDSDTFALDEDLLSLSLIWRWRAQKRLEYAEDMANYEKALAEIMGRNKGSKILAEGRPTMPANVRTAYPWPLGA